MSFDAIMYYCPLYDEPSLPDLNKQILLFFVSSETFELVSDAGMPVCASL